jgi:hypothetical protein
MVKVFQFWIMNTANVDYTDRWTGQILIRWLASLDRNPMQMCQQTTGKEIVFVGSARMGHYPLDGHDVAQFRIGIKFEINKHKNIPTKRMHGTCSTGKKEGVQPILFVTQTVCRTVLVQVSWVRLARLIPAKTRSKTLSMGRRMSQTQKRPVPRLYPHRELAWTSLECCDRQHGSLPDSRTRRDCCRLGYRSSVTLAPGLIVTSRITSAGGHYVVRSTNSFHKNT